jgi:wyosine [tRNA(Phe)-imidazoG37] synthetase (radical SAM superfamily)
MDVIGTLKHMPLDRWERLLDGIKHHPIEEAKLMGMGEPMLHPQFDEVCKMFKDTFPDVRVIVATNCQYKIKPNTKFRKKFENSLKYIDMCYLSIDGHGEHYERDRAPAKWDVLINFLEDFKTTNRHGCETPINYVVNAYNVYDIPKVEKLIDAGLYTTVEGDVKMCCLNTGAKSFGNLFENSIDEIKLTEEYQKVKIGCETNNPIEHCKNCSYKELVPILSHLGVNN